MKGDLKDRLQQLQRTGEIKTGRQLAEVLNTAVEDRLFPGEGREAETPFGRCYMRELSFPLDYRHGNGNLAGFLTCTGKPLALPARDNNLRSFKPEKSVFLDIETTGLTGGTGTWAFLIGLGWLEEDSFLLRQYFLRQPAEERSILSQVAELTDQYPIMITFNGKMFDLPLIQTRQLLTGIRQTVPEIHLDLLQCSRALWKRRLASRSLRSIEENLLGLRRYDDIPGAEIPEVYFDYLRRGKTARLKQVFHHNVLDILSMVTLLERIACLGAGQNIEHPGEALALGRLCLEEGRATDGITFLRQAASGKGIAATEAALDLALYHKRKGNWNEALAIWFQLAEKEDPNPLAMIELAKHLEHREKDFSAALDLTEGVLTIITQAPDHYTNYHLKPETIRHRQARLKKRLGEQDYIKH